MIRLIVAMDRNGVIGVGNRLPWHIPGELEHFKRETIGRNIIIGRNTWDSLPESVKPLPNRHNIVVSGSEVEGAHRAVNSPDEALSLFSDLTVIGGKSIYDYFIYNGLVDEMIVSIVKETVPDSHDNVVLEYYAPSYLYLKSSEKHSEFIVHRYARRGAK